MVEKKRMLSVLLMVSALMFVLSPANAGRWKDKIYITDRQGEKWDITQAVSLGFEPEKFQHGIGRNAIKPVDDDALDDDHDSLPGGSRVIGVESQGEAHAYSVRKLTRHEIANTTIGSQAIAAGY